MAIRLLSVRGKSAQGGYESASFSGRCCRLLDLCGICGSLLPFGECRSTLARHGPLRGAHHSLWSCLCLARRVCHGQNCSAHGSELWNCTGDRDRSGRDCVDGCSPRRGRARPRRPRCCCLRRHRSQATGSAKEFGGVLRKAALHAFHAEALVRTSVFLADGGVPKSTICFLLTRAFRISDPRLEDGNRT